MIVNLCVLILQFFLVVTFSTHATANINAARTGLKCASLLVNETTKTGAFIFRDNAAELIVNSILKESDLDPRTNVVRPESWKDEVKELPQLYRGFRYSVGHLRKMFRSGLTLSKSFYEELYCTEDRQLAATYALTECDENPKKFVAIVVSIDPKFQDPGFNRNDQGEDLIEKDVPITAIRKVWIYQRASHSFVALAWRNK